MGFRNLQEKLENHIIDHLQFKGVIEILLHHTVFISEFHVYTLPHGLRTPNEGINQRYLKNWADVADKICCRHT